ncbi:MAG: hypothetical protein AABZ92_06170 [Verrucomicrobiota bacterium]
MNSGFTCTELEVRKWWLRVFLFSILLEMISCIDALELGQIPKDVLSTGSAFGLFCLYKWMFYYFGYLKKGVKFLTYALYVGALGIGIQALSFCFEEVLIFRSFNLQLRKMHPLFLFLTYLTSFAFFYANVKLRRVNKIRKLSSNPQTLT